MKNERQIASHEDVTKASGWIATNRDACADLTASAIAKRIKAATTAKLVPKKVVELCATLGVDFKGANGSNPAEQRQATNRIAYLAKTLRDFMAEQGGTPPDRLCALADHYRTPINDEGSDDAADADTDTAPVS